MSRIPLNDGEHIIIDIPRERPSGSKSPSSRKGIVKARSGTEELGRRRLMKGGPINFFDAAQINSSGWIYNDFNVPYGSPGTVPSQSDLDLLVAHLDAYSTSDLSSLFRPLGDFKSVFNATNGGYSLVVGGETIDLLDTNADFTATGVAVEQADLTAAEQIYLNIYIGSDTSRIAWLGIIPLALKGPAFASLNQKITNTPDESAAHIPGFQLQTGAKILLVPEWTRFEIVADDSSGPDVLRGQEFRFVPRNISDLAMRTNFPSVNSGDPDASEFIDMVNLTATIPSIGGASAGAILAEFSGGSAQTRAGYDPGTTALTAIVIQNGLRFYCWQMY